MWDRGLRVGAVNFLPRNMFGLAECCGGLQDFPGSPTFGLGFDITTPINPPLGFTNLAYSEAEIKPFNLWSVASVLAPGPSSSQYVHDMLRPKLLRKEFPISRILFGGQRWEESISNLLLLPQA